MKRTATIFLLVSSILVSSIISVSPVRAAGTSTQPLCNPAIGSLFPCLGEAINAYILGANKQTEPNMAKTWGDMWTSFSLAINTELGGATQCVRDSDCGGGGKTCKNTVCVAAGESPWAANINPYFRGGMMGKMAAVGDSIYNLPPSNFVDAKKFATTVLSNNILNPAPAYAAGVDTLSSYGLLSLWRFTRNAAYTAIAVVLAIFGLMVMLRAKSDPRTVVTFQMALPKVAIAIVVIYFSFPLAGILLDGSEVMTQVIKSVFCQTGGGCALEKPVVNWRLGTPAMDNYPVDTSAGNMYQAFILGALSTDIFGAQITLPGGLPVNIFGFANWTVAGLIKIFVFFLILHTVWTLISRYVQIIIQTSLAPINFLIGALPGREEQIGHWIKTFLVNALTFPGVYFVINIANYIRLYGYNNNTPLPTAAGPDFTRNVSGLLAIGILSLAPRVPALLEEFFDVVPGAHASRAGISAGTALRGVPILGRFLG